MPGGLTICLEFFLYFWLVLSLVGELPRLQELFLFLTPSWESRSRLVPFHFFFSFSSSFLSPIWFCNVFSCPIIILRFVRSSQIFCVNSSTYSCIYTFFFFFVFLPILGQLLRHMEVPRLGVESELWMPAYARATATQDPSHICKLLHSSW